MNRNLLRRLNFLMQPSENLGLELCKTSLLDITFGSHVERRRWSLRYLQEGRLRALAEISRGNLHGEFLILYPDGKIWMRGTYRNNTLVETSMKIFMPDGSLAKPSLPHDNVVPFRRTPKGNI